MYETMWLGTAHKLALNPLVSRILRELSGFLVILPMEFLKPHELTESPWQAVQRVEIRNDGFLRKAILVDRQTLTVLDGHHRIEALRKLMPPKTTKHIIRSRGRAFHASFIEPDLNIFFQELF